MKKNLFIALEGIDGSGKSTQSKLLAEKLAADGYRVYSTFEPTDNFIGLIIRNILRGNKKADNRTIAALFAADRLDHLLNEENGIVKKLEEGYTVITDRYYFSSYAYHSVHMDMDWVIHSNAMSAGILRPDINIFIDVTPDVAMQRINNNRDGFDLYETLDNLRNVRGKYLDAFARLGNEEKIVSVQGDHSAETVSGNIVREIQRSLNL